MATTTLGGNPVHTSGDLPEVGAPCPSFTLTKNDMSDLTNDDLLGKRVVLNISPSLDTTVCAIGARHFNELAAGLDNTVVVCVTSDLPFAQGRFCTTEGLADVVAASSFRSDFGPAFGVELVDGRLRGLLARAVVVVDEHGTVSHTQLVPEIAHEPDYDAVVAALS